MQTYKYTGDGKKVVIVGKLNAQETIVQEIFVSGGSEIPSGEHFVVKSLHDAPSESWKEKNLREIEDRYERTKIRLESEEKQARRQLELCIAKAKERAKCFSLFAQNSDNSQLDLLLAFFTGEVTHFVVLSYDPKIITADDNYCFQMDNHYGESRVEAMKLISVFGSSDGRLDYRISDYRDGSGGSTRIIPCRSYQEALGHLQEYCDGIISKYKANDSSSRAFDFDKWLKIDGIVIPQDVIRMSKEDQARRMAEKISKAKESLEKEEAALTDLRNQL